MTIRIPLEPKPEEYWAIPQWVADGTCTGPYEIHFHQGPSGSMEHVPMTYSQLTAEVTQLRAQNERLRARIQELVAAPEKTLVENMSRAVADMVDRAVRARFSRLSDDQDE